MAGPDTSNRCPAQSQTATFLNRGQRRGDDGKIHSPGRDSGAGDRATFASWAGEIVAAQTRLHHDSIQAC